MTSHRCVLIRHGETEWSRNGRHTGRTDLALLPEGEAQVTSLAPTLTGFEFATVLTSPLLRARQTCALAGLDEGAEVDPDLVEWDYGTVEGLTTPDIRRGQPGWDLFEDGAPGGESADQVGVRVDRVIRRVRAVPGDVACVAHAHVLAGARRPLDRSAGVLARSFALAPASVSVLGWEREQPVISAVEPALSAPARSAGRWPGLSRPARPLAVGWRSIGRVGARDSARNRRRGPDHRAGGALRAAARA